MWFAGLIKLYLLSEYALEKLIWVQVYLSKVECPGNASLISNE